MNEAQQTGCVGQWNIQPQVTENAAGLHERHPSSCCRGIHREDSHGVSTLRPGDLAETEHKVPMSPLQLPSRITSLAPNPGLLRRQHCSGEDRCFMCSSAVHASPSWSNQLMMLMWH